MTLFRGFFRHVMAFFSGFRVFFLWAFRSFFQSSTPRKKGQTPQKEKETDKESNPHPQKAGPTFIAKGQPPLQKGMANTESKKEGQEGRVNQHQKKTGMGQTPTHRKKGQPPHLEKEGPNTNPETRGPTHSEKAGRGPSPRRANPPTLRRNDEPPLHSKKEEATTIMRKTGKGQPRKGQPPLLEKKKPTKRAEKEGDNSHKSRPTSHPRSNCVCHFL